MEIEESKRRMNRKGSAFSRQKRMSIGIPRSIVILAFACAPSAVMADSPVDIHPVGAVSIGSVVPSSGTSNAPGDGMPVNPQVIADANFRAMVQEAINAHIAARQITLRLQFSAANACINVVYLEWLRAYEATALADPSTAAVATALGGPSEAEKYAEKVTTENSIYNYLVTPSDHAESLGDWVHTEISALRTTAAWPQSPVGIALSTPMLESLQKNFVSCEESPDFKAAALAQLVQIPGAGSQLVGSTVDSDTQCKTFPGPNGTATMQCSLTSGSQETINQFLQEQGFTGELQ